jgi:hypothetical protein
VATPGTTAGDPLSRPIPRMLTLALKPAGEIESDGWTSPVSVDSF